MITRKRISRVSQADPETKYQLPILRGWVFGKSIIVYCPFCDRFHKHGWNQEDTARDIYYPGAHCDVKDHPVAGGSGVLYGVSPFRKADSKILKQIQKDAEWYAAHLKALKVSQDSQKPGKGGAA